MKNQNKISYSAMMQRFIQTLLLCVVALTSLNATAVERVTYYHNDALGSPVAGTDKNGNLLWREEYEPYGERILREDADSNTLWFTGKQEETAFGINYFGARWYDPTIGRFMAVDKVGFKNDKIQSFNRYAYANNNPYLYVDPDGRDSYLVSRQLSFTENGNHNFIVSNAKFLGDPKATVSSFGDIGNDTMGQVTKDTKGFSEGTNATDTKAWQGLANDDSSATYRKINAEDSVVDNLVKNVDKGLEYSLVPEIQGGVNSNTGAGAVAKKADGGSASINNGKRQPGSSNRVVNKIKFKNIKD